MKKKYLKKQIKDLKYEKSVLETEKQGILEQIEASKESWQNTLKNNRELMYMNRSKDKQIKELHKELTYLKNPLTKDGLEKPNPTVGGPGSCIQKGAEELNEIQKTVQKEWQEGFVEAALSGNPTKIQASKGVLDGYSKEELQKKVDAMYKDACKGMKPVLQNVSEAIDQLNINGNPV